MRKKGQHSAARTGCVQYVLVWTALNNHTHTHAKTVSHGKEKKRKKEEEKKGERRMLSFLDKVECDGHFAPGSSACACR